MSKYKPLIITAVIALVAVAIATRVGFIRKVVFPSTTTTA